MATWFKYDERKPSLLVQLCYKVLNAGCIPQHVAFIMDGNRRFAKQENITRKEGHSKGFEKLTEVLQWCYELSIPEVTVYAFSIENFKRSSDEVHGLMKIFVDKLQRLLDEQEKLTKHGVCVRFIGDITLFTKEIQECMAKLVLLTKDNSKSCLNVAMPYTSRDEITQAIKEIAIGVDEGKIKESDINEELIENCFYTNQSKPVDLLIRTSGEVRLSDFLLWQKSLRKSRSEGSLLKSTLFVMYIQDGNRRLLEHMKTSFSILCFIEVLWPAFSVWDFFYCILKYQLGFTSMQNAKELSNLREIRSQMDSDLLQACRDLRTSNANDTTSVDADVMKYTQERKARTETFLNELNEKRMNYLKQQLL